MLSGRVIQSRWARWTLIFGLWTLIGLGFSSQLYLSRANIGSPVTWRYALERSLADSYVFAVLTIPALWLARRFHLERVHWPRQLAIHLLASAAFSVLWMIMRAAIAEWQTPAGERQVTFRDAFTHALVATFFFNLF